MNLPPAPGPSGEAEPWEPVVTRPDPMTDQEWEARLACEPGVGEDPEEWQDEDEFLPPGALELTAGELAGIREAAELAASSAAEVATAGELARAAGAGRRGPGQPGSARRLSRESASAAAAFGTGLCLDVMPACPDLAVLADRAAGRDDSYAGVSDDELAGVLCAWDRLEAHMAARKLAAAAELSRRRPAPAPDTRYAGADDDFTADELACTLAESRRRAAGLLGTAEQLRASLPGTWAALRDGDITLAKAQVIAAATVLLDEAEAAAAEDKVLGRAGRLTPGGLRGAIARAVMEVAPGKARKRREAAARSARVEQWAEDSGNAALAGRELPPAEALAAGQRITWWARQLRAAGLEGDLDQLRARALIDLLTGTDSRPGSTGQDGAGQDGTPGPWGPGPDLVPAGIAGKITLTVPAATLLGLADRPGEIPGFGPVDPWLSRDLATAAAANPATTWCVTVTDADGHAVGHGCARPQPTNHGRRAKRDGPAFAFTPASRDGPPGGYGTWTLRTPGPGPDLAVELEPVTTQDCDHRHQAKGHDPGVKLRHLAQVRHATCTSPVCRRPAATCDYEHNTPYEAGGRTCLCNGGPKCRHDHRVKQHPRWSVDQLPDGTFRWTTPSGRTYATEPTRYPI